MNFQRWKEGQAAEMQAAIELFGDQWTDEQKKAVEAAKKALEPKRRRKRRVISKSK